MVEDSPILDSLNAAQREAVCVRDNHCLVLAGAGSGKTRVLVHRIAWLLGPEGVSGHDILAVTFTNKAASEMRARIEAMLHRSASGMWVGTFHGLSHRLLRTHWRDAGLMEGFQILDSDDQFRVIKRLLKDANLDPEQWPPKRVQWYINTCKDDGLRPVQVEADRVPGQDMLLKLYVAYEQNCQRAGLVDFAELLLRSYELLTKNPHILEHYQQRFKHLLIDEFQDTNQLQYSWIRALAGTHSKVFVVGDDDQSIYGWRGARIENIQRFPQEFAGAKTVRLEQNYRSTNNILEAANALIRQNTGRLGKELWSDGEKGELLGHYSAYNDIDEARFVGDQIQQWVRLGNPRRDAAVLYRSNAQSRLFEEAFIALRIPYRVYGGLRFFDRAEIKDALAYLRLMLNRDDDAAFDRVINTPPRGIGDKTLDLVKQQAKDADQSLWNAMVAILQTNLLTARAFTAVKGFVDLIEQLDFNFRGQPLFEQTDNAIRTSGLHEYYSKDRSEVGQSRVENLDELVSAARSWQKPVEDEVMSDLASFLGHAALEAGERQADDNNDYAQLMTLHSAKGLEFPLVFMVGMEEGLFPHSRATHSNADLEEERRLCYVGLTRARRKLILTHAESRRIHGKDNRQRISQFLAEIPAKLLAEFRPKVNISRPIPTVAVPPKNQIQDRANSNAPNLGQRVQHDKFGEGIVLAYEGDGATMRVQINFTIHGSKWFLVDYAGLRVV